jgi:hypothetical protein
MRTLIPFAALVIAQATSAQRAPAVRPIGRLERVSSDSLGFRSIATALAMPDGRVMVNDIRGRRVLLLDSTLSHGRVVADTTSGTANAYGASWSTLIRYRGDSALLMVPSTLSMYVFAPNGSTARVVAMPRPNEAPVLAARTPLGSPAIDARGRLVYYGTIGAANSTLLLARTTPWLEHGKPAEIASRIIARGGSWVSPTLQRADSGAITRVDFTTRVMDTVALLRIPKFRREVKVDEGGFATSIEVTVDPLPLSDQWTVLRDGTIAIVRGADYHVDWIDPAGRRSSTPKMAFDWQPVGDARKTQLIDSTVADRQRAYSRDAGAGGRSGRSGPGGVDYVRNIVLRASPADVPDYYPAFGVGAVLSDWDGNVWIRTSATSGGRGIYDVVDRRGDVVDRVQLPEFRTIAGFGPGVVYMAMIDATGAVRLERARLR